MPLCAGGDCDLVTPQSTVRSKGFWGPVEGLELLLNLTAAGSAFVNNPLNFRRVQVPHPPASLARGIQLR